MEWDNGQVDGVAIPRQWANVHLRAGGRFLKEQSMFLQSVTLQIERTMPPGMKHGIGERGVVGNLESFGGYI